MSNMLVLGGEAAASLGSAILSQIVRWIGPVTAGLVADAGIDAGKSFIAGLVARTNISDWDLPGLERSLVEYIRMHPAAAQLVLDAAEDALGNGTIGKILEAIKAKIPGLTNEHEIRINKLVESAVKADQVMQRSTGDGSEDTMMGEDLDDILRADDKIRMSNARVRTLVRAFGSLAFAEQVYHAIHKTEKQAFDIYRGHYPEQV